MEKLQWDPPSTVGVGLLDEQHHRMHRLIMGLAGDLQARPGDAACEDRFIEIFETIVEHFRAEEDFLQSRGYPGLKAHQFEHELLLDWFRDQMAQRTMPGKRPLALLAREAAEIIQGHQASVDRDYAEWLKSH